MANQSLRLRLKRLLGAKNGQRLSTSLVLLTTENNRDGIGRILKKICGSLVGRFSLFDEIIVLDTHALQCGREIADRFSVPVFQQGDLLQRYGSRQGLGDVLWKSLYVTTGDIVLWCDVCSADFDPNMLVRLVEPLLRFRSFKMVKGVLPLGQKGVMLGGRRELLESLPFACGNDAGIDLMMRAIQKAGAGAVARVDHNRSAKKRSKACFAITRPVGQAETPPVCPSNTLYSDALKKRFQPPMRSVCEYRNRFGMGEVPLTGVKQESLLWGILNNPDDIFLLPGRFISWC